jgi:hypothetical protein
MPPASAVHFHIMLLLGLRELASQLLDSAALQQRGQLCCLLLAPVAGTKRAENVNSCARRSSKKLQSQSTHLAALSASRPAAHSSSVSAAVAVCRNRSIPRTK